MNAVAKTVPPWQTTLAALVSLTLFSVADGFSVVVALLAVALLAVYLVPGRLTRGTLGMWLTRVVLYGAVLALNTDHPTALTDTWITALGLDRYVPVLAAEMVLRAWSAPTNSRQMLLISGFIVLGGCSTPDARIGLYFVPAYFAAVILALRADRHRPAGRQIAPQLVRGLALALALGLGAAGQWVFHVYKNQIMALGEGTFAASPHKADAPVSGIEKNPQLGETFDSPGSSSRIYRIAGDLPDAHLHGMAFDTYARGAWMSSFDARHFEAPPPGLLYADASGPRVHFTRLEDDDGMISAPLNSAGIDLGRVDGVTWAAATNGPLRLELDGPLAYDVILGASDTFQGVFAAPLTPAERVRCLEIPAEVSPQLRDLARQIAGRLPNSKQKADAVQRFLMQNNSYSYAAQPGPGDPVSDFVLHRRAGHCEYFASAATIMLRCVGVPTRYVIGYYAHEPDGPGQTVVRGQDAHAWAESWIDGVGWETVDATPANGRPSATARTPFWWKLRDRWQDFTLFVQGSLSGPRQWVLLAVLAVALLASSLVRARRSRSAPVLIFAYDSPPPALNELAARFDRLLTRRGLPCPPDRSWREHLASRIASLNDSGSYLIHLGNYQNHLGNSLNELGKPVNKKGSYPFRFGSYLDKSGTQLNELGSYQNHSGNYLNDSGNELLFPAKAAAFVDAYNRARFGNDADAVQQAAHLLQELEKTL